jgi:hypothetical protein
VRLPLSGRLIPQAAHIRLESTSIGSFLVLNDRDVFRSCNDCISDFPPFISGGKSLIGLSSAAIEEEAKQNIMATHRNTFFNIIPSIL